MQDKKIVIRNLMCFGIIHFVIQMIIMLNILLKLEYVVSNKLLVFYLIGFGFACIFGISLLALISYWIITPQIYKRNAGMIASYTWVVSICVCIVSYGFGTLQTWLWFLLKSGRGGCIELYFFIALAGFSIPLIENISKIIVDTIYKLNIKQNKRNN